MKYYIPGTELYCLDFAIRQISGDVFSKLRILFSKYPVDGNRNDKIRIYDEAVL
jgi:hypothetical protein